MRIRAFFLVLMLPLLGLPSRSAPPQSAPSKRSGRLLAGYTVLVLQAFKVAPAAEKAGIDDANAKLLQAALLLKLREKKLFDEVVDGAPAPDSSAQPSAAASQPRRLIASGTITDFTPGSRAERYLVGFGAGAAKLKVQFVLQDAASGEELLRVDDHRTYWAGTFGGSKSDATTQTAEGMAQSLTNDIKKNR